MKWLKNGAVKCLYFKQLFLHDILFGENFIDYVKVPLYSVCLNLNHEKKKKNSTLRSVIDIPPLINF